VVATRHRFAYGLSKEVLAHYIRQKVRRESLRQLIKTTWVLWKWSQALHLLETCAKAMKASAHPHRWLAQMDPPLQGAEVWEIDVSNGASAFTMEAIKDVAKLAMTALCRYYEVTWPITKPTR
jgi:hypothetical protein